MAEASAIDPNRPTRVVATGYLLITVCVALFLERVVGVLFNATHINDTALVGDWTKSSLVGYALAIAIAVGVYMNPRVNALSFEVAQELKKVSWPSREDTQTNTIAVIIFSLVSAGIMGLFDVVSSKVMTTWIPDMLTWLGKHV